MKKLRLNNNTLMPALGLGTWQSAPGEVGRAVEVAVRAGYRHIDCASIYGNEAEIGESLAALMADGVVARKDLWVTSKLWNDRHAPEDVAPALRETLDKLKLEQLDLYLVHWPVALHKGVLRPQTAADMRSLEDIPPAQTWAQMESLVDAGLCRTIGVSNFSVHKLEALIASSRIRPAVNQVELHPYLQQPKLLEACHRENVVLTAYSPLGSRGRPAVLKTTSDPDLLEDETVVSIAASHRVTPAQVLIAWALSRGTSVIPKSANPNRIRQNFEAASVILAKNDLEKLAGLDRHRRYINGAFWALDGGPYTLANLWDE